MIEVKSKLRKLDRFVNANDAYLKLRKVLSEDELFLLESLSGSKADKNKVLVGFNPMLSLILQKSQLKIIGNEYLAELVIKEITEKLDLPIINKNQFKLIDIHELIKTLRVIESLFEIEYLGSHRGFQFGFFGYIDGGINSSFENNLSSDKDHNIDLPDLNLSIYQGLVYSDLVSKSTSLIINQIQGAPCYSRQSIQTLLIDEEMIPYDIIDDEKVPKVENQTSFAEHKLLSEKVEKIKYSIAEFAEHKLLSEKVEKIKYSIADGEIFQAFVNQQVSMTSSIAPFDVYQRLCKIAPAPYMYYANFNTYSIIGASPELLMKLEDDTITMRPVSSCVYKNDCDHVLLKKEHLLLADLCRNDVAKISVSGSLKINEYATKESDSHQLKLVSDISGQCSEKYDKYEVLFSLLPPVVLTGAPRANLASLSLKFSQKSYCSGCIGFIDFRDIIQTALCVRTLIYQKGLYTACAASNVMADSSLDVVINKIENILNPMLKAIKGSSQI
ncbi:chorismate-binding protein [Thiotrichales bacterium 19S3-7]|nr:chorismate-binding protein [Thiotrichales bacterium 19S3-7]MCF6801972.1 chorismate-binding protein [Thiotrichales bacterium 19S3-11]